MTNFNKYITNLQTRDEHTDVEIIELEGRINVIENNVFQKFCEIQDQIEVLCQENDLENQYTEKANFENSYYALLAEGKMILNNSKQVNISDQRSDNGSEGSFANSRVANVDGSLQGVKLPTINLPKFNGSLQNWLEFRDIYESLIHKNELISDIQRFHYLRASLSDEPAQLINGIEFSATNYKLVWEQLKSAIVMTKC